MFSKSSKPTLTAGNYHLEDFFLFMCYRVGLVKIFIIFYCEELDEVTETVDMITQQVKPNRLNFKALLHVIVCLNVLLVGVNCETKFPRGHLEPLGGHRDPDPVEELTVDQIPSPLQFWKDYIIPSKPVVFRGAAFKSPGSWLWTDSYLKDKYGDLEMRLEGHKEKAAGRPFPEGDVGLGRDTIRHFINTYRNSHKYIVSELPKKMFHEVKTLPFFGCSPYKEHITEVDMWMNGNNASSIMHKDAFNQMNCLFNGTKKWKLIAWKYEKKIYKKHVYPPQFSGISKINVSAVDLIKYPLVAEVPWLYTVVNAGDCLFLPGSMYHQVQSSGEQNLAVSLLFKRFQYPFFPGENDALDFSKCENQTLDFKSLNELELDWEYSGTGTLSMGNAEFASFRTGALLDLYTKKKLSLKKITNVVRGQLPEFRYKVEQEAARIYLKIIDIVGDDKLPSQETLRNKTLLRKLALLIEPEESSNNYNLEYSVVDPGDIIKILRTCIKQGKGKGTRENFKKLYQKYLFGTEKFGERFVTSLIGNDTEFFTVEDLKSKVEKALSPYYLYNKESGDEKKEDVGELEKSYSMEYNERMKGINEADDPSIFGENDMKQDDNEEGNEGEGTEDEGDEGEQAGDDGENVDGDQEGNEEVKDGDEDGLENEEDSEGSQRDDEGDSDGKRQDVGSDEKAPEEDTDEQGEEEGEEQDIQSKEQRKKSGAKDEL